MRHAAAFLALFLLCVPAWGLEAGAAKVETTPPIGTPLNGYGDRLGRSSTGVHDPLHARALYLDDGDTRVFLVNIDLCMINPELRARVLELAPVEVPREHIILTATHTHSAQGAMYRHLPLRFVAGRFMPEVLEGTARGIARAMHDAYENRRRAAIGYGVAEQQVLSVNRRDPEGPIDEQIGVIRVDDADGQAIAIVTNFAAHPTSVPKADHYAISADYVGFYYDHLEKLATPGCIALFLNGAEGNQRIGNPEHKEGWERLESVGRLLAVRAKAIANRITCGEAILHVGYATPTLPPTLSSNFLPASTIVQTLEINDLLLTFFPGEPCVELGFEMRRRALARGYGGQFTVGLSNDYLMYFIPRAFYSHPNYEAAQNYYGPRIEDWFYREFSKLMTRGEPEPETEAPFPIEVNTIPGACHVVLADSPYVAGFQRGRAFREDIHARYQERVVRPLESGEILPTSGVWSYWPPFLNPASVGLPMLAMSARRLLSGVAAPVFEEIEGMADGAGLPFDALWLLQNSPEFALREDREALFETPLCTMFAVIGDRAGADDLLIGRNLDWAAAEMPVVVEGRPASGHHYVSVGFSWNAGVFTGMNDAGLVFCVERVGGLGSSDFTGPPLEMVLRELLETTTDFNTAVERLASLSHVRGFHVLMAGVDEGVSRAVVLCYGESIRQREAEDGLLLGALPGDYGVDEAVKVRYGRVAELLGDERIVGRHEIERVLADKAPGASGLARIWNEATRHSVVFEPRIRTVRAAFPDGRGEVGPYTTFSLGGRPADE